MDRSRAVEPPVASGGLPNNTKRRRRVPGWGTWLILAVLAGLIAAVRASDVLADHAYANVATCFFGFLGLVTLAVWFLARSGYSRLTKVRAVAAVLGTLGLLGVLFRLDHVSGELVPVWSFRFSPKHDRLIAVLSATPAEATAGAGVDLHSTTHDDFPQFLGPGRLAAVEDARLGRDWDARPPQRLWRHEIGAGWSGFAVVNGHALTMEQRGEQELVTCYDVTSGRLQWSFGWAVRYEAVAGGIGPRCTPTVDRGRVYALGSKGHLLCLDGSCGTPLWQRNLLDDLGTTPEADAAAVPHGRAGSPLIVGNLVIVAGGGQAGHQAALLAYNAETGRPVWQGGQRQISYSSPARAQLAGVDQILIVNENTVSGHDPDSGRVLWEHGWPGRSAGNANVAQAFPVPPDRLLVSKAYGQGALMLQLAMADGGVQPSVVWKNAKVLRTKFTNVTLYQGHFYALSDGVLECVEAASGRSRWKEGRYQHGQLLRAGDLLLVLSEEGEVVLVEATPERSNHVLGRVQALEGMTWNTLALAGPYLLIRNAEQAACYKLPLENQPRP